jgi:hypothetical protein
MTPAPNRYCPLCGESNECAPAVTGSFATDCWCRAVVVPASALAGLSEEQRGIACLCRRCIAAAAQDEA